MHGQQNIKITCKFLYCNHQLHTDFLITLYNVTLMRVFAVIVVVEKQYILCILSVCF